MYMYKFHCMKCGYYEERPNKVDIAMVKRDHKRDGCGLQPAPHLSGWIWARPQLAQEAIEGQRILEEQNAESNPSV